MKNLDGAMLPLRVSPRCQRRRRPAFSYYWNGSSSRFLSSAVPILFLVFVSAEFSAAQAPFEGDQSCPCLLSADQGLPPIDPEDITDDLIQQIGGTNSSDIAVYGVGCAPHDETTPICTTDDCSLGPNYLPAPVDCDRDWCQRSFCWVDPLNCELLNRRSAYFSKSGRYYSYATCYEMDSFTDQYLLSSLRGRTLKVGFNSNSGGWTGAYSTTGEHFKGGIEKWSGPAVTFAREAALAGGFRLQLTEPPTFLRNESYDFFGASSFSYCVYATALGYLDMCVSQYSVTDQRASATDWFLLGNEPLYLIVQTDSGNESNWDEFLGYVATIFQPLTLGAWMFIVLFVIPVMGMLFVYHEYGRAGSAFPKQEQVLVSDDHETYEVQEHAIPLRTHLIHSIYTTLLSVLHQSYGGSLVTPGAMFHLLGFAFFILTIIAVYTANLAAILTQQAQVTSVQDFEDALSRGYRFCGERTNIADMELIYGVKPSAFVVDPIEEGGDGQPGFTCSNCQSRTRVFDFLDTAKAESGDPRYCHAALAPLQDLQVLQNAGQHCNKTDVGQPIRYIQSGFPVSERVSRETIAMLLRLKNGGVYDRELVNSQPVSRCSVEGPQDSEGSALSVVQLMGIWVVTFGFAFGGVLITLCQPWWKKVARRKNKQIVKKVHRRNQNMIRTQKLDRSDSFLGDNTTIVNGRRIFTGVLDNENQSLRRSDHGPLHLDGQRGVGFTDTMRGVIRHRSSTQTSATDNPVSGRSESHPQENWYSRNLESGAADFDAIDQSLRLDVSFHG